MSEDKPKKQSDTKAVSRRDFVRKGAKAVYVVPLVLAITLGVSSQFAFAGEQTHRASGIETKEFAVLGGVVARPIGDKDAAEIRGSVIVAQHPMPLAAFGRNCALECDVVVSNGVYIMVGPLSPEARKPKEIVVVGSKVKDVVGPYF